MEERKIITFVQPHEEPVTTLGEMGLMRVMFSHWERKEGTRGAVNCSANGKTWKV
jgi:hypothetical protein